MKGKATKAKKATHIFRGAATRQFVREYYGPRCDTYVRGCATCDAWRDFALTGRVKVFVDREKFFKLLLKGAL